MFYFDRRVREEAVALLANQPNIVVQRAIEQAVEAATEPLIETISGLVERYNLLLAKTGGGDAR